MRATRADSNARSLLVGKIFGAGAFGAVLGLVAASFGPAGLVNMATAYAMLIFAWVIGTTAAIFSEILWRFPVRHRVLGGVGVSLLLALCLGGVAAYQRRAAYELTHIVPGDSPSPPDRCHFPKDEFKVFLGDTSIFSAPTFPFTAISFGQYPNGSPYAALQIARQGDSIEIQVLRIFGTDGTIITRIDRNKIWVNSSLRSERPNAHTLIVFDNKDKMVLRLDFMNMHTLYVTGIFRRPDYGFLSVHRNSIEFPNHMAVSGTCARGSGVGINYGILPISADD